MRKKRGRALRAQISALAVLKQKARALCQKNPSQVLGFFINL